MTACLPHPKAPWALRILPPFPAVAHRILALVSNEDVNTREIGELIKLDPAFAAELIRLANSALFGVPREVKGLIQAIVLLGLDRVKSMATFVAMNNLVRSVRVEALRQIWLHSVATAFIAEEAARITEVDRDTAYTSGLLHNLGSLGLMVGYPAEYSRMLDVTNEFGFDLLKTERDLFEIDHCAAGAYLAQDWNFPDEFAAAIATHHDDRLQAEPGLDTVVKVSWRLADALGYRSFSCERPWAFEDLIDFFPGHKDSWLKRTPARAQAELEQLLLVARS
jgi:putative nucleotidyltransferase with HDIG domain